VTTALVALGSNIGDRDRTLEWAAGRIRAACAAAGSFKASHLYETPPWGGVPQADYLNAVVLFETAIEARPLLDLLLGIEREAGRERGERWGPRSLDLDLLDLGGLVVDQPGLVLPHPGIAERPFVLVPLCELSPAWRHPLTGRTAAEMLRALDPDPGDARLHAPPRAHPDGEETRADSAAT
jgi:2-amino-4-hydroxy-6-hydroxymethyldihydropteridine diphosphokinase